MPTVGILGAGAMGAGIAQVAATAGWDVRLIDVDPATATAAMTGIGKRSDRIVAKGLLTSQLGKMLRQRLDA